ncbi:MAG: hypothetical protein WCK34_13465 [Bacteroidota bacterium]
MKFSHLKSTMTDENRNHENKLEKRAEIKPWRAIAAKTTRNKPDIAIAIGNTVVTDEAISGDCVNPIKKNDNNAVEGSPPMNPPVLLPNRSPASTVKYIQPLPIKNVSSNCSRNIFVIMLIVNLQKNV